MSLLLAGLALTLTHSAIASDLSNPSLDPDAEYPNVEHKHIHPTICIKENAKAIRPYANYTGEPKKLQLSGSGYDRQARTLYEEEHSFPRSTDRNLNASWHRSPEPHDRERIVWKNDRFEIEIYRLACAQEVTYCGSTAHDVDKQALGIQRFCAWNSLSSRTWVWSFKLQ